jgi:hypothetical protein
MNSNWQWVICLVRLKLCFSQNLLLGIFANPTQNGGLVDAGGESNQSLNDLKPTSW